MRQKIVTGLLIAMIAFCPVALAQAPSSPTAPRRIYPPRSSQAKATRAANCEALIVQIRWLVNMVSRAVKERVMHSSIGQTLPNARVSRTIL